MAQYTIAERQTIKDQLADEKYFRADLELLRRKYPHHVLLDECKRANNLNRISLCRRMIYLLLTRATIEEILNNRKSYRADEETKTYPESIRDIHSKIREKVSGWKRKLQKLLSGGK
jgi:hypothetical protein